MGLDPSAAGTETAVHELPYDWKVLALYALGIGARADELDYLYEARGPKVFPTVAVVPAYAPIMELLQRTGGDLSQLVHGGQSVRLLRPAPPSGVFRTTARITGIYDLKRLGEVVCTTRTLVDGEPTFETTWSLLFRGDGGFGGRPPPRERGPKPAEGQSPLFEHVEATSKEQAILYRLSGDLNPLHVDPDFARAVGFERGPILHGLATFGFVARAVIRHACGGDGDRLRFLSAQFRRPVWPGDSIHTIGYPAGERVSLRVSAGESGDPVLGDCWAEIAP